MADNEHNRGDQEQLYRDVWGAEPGQPTAQPSRQRGPDGASPADVGASHDDAQLTGQGSGWDPGSRLHVLELEVRELRTAIQVMQRSNRGSIAALRLSIQKLSEALGSPESEPLDPAPPTPIEPERPAQVQ